MQICLQEFDSRRAPGYAPRMSILSENIEALRRHLGDSQLEFAARFQTGQSTVSKWINKGAQPEVGPMMKLAELAGTTIESFRSELWRPDQPRDARAVVMLPVSLPSAAVLTRMFEGLLEPDVARDQLDELAQRLAQRLPAALARAVDSPAVPVRDARLSPDEGAPPPAKRRGPRQPERRT